MKFGVVLPIWRLAVAEAETLVLKAEELGFDGVFVPDHIMAKPATTQHYGPSWPDPFSLLAFFAARTRRIQVGASVIVLPYRPPLVTAKAAATVDQVSDGRFIFGIGVGWDEEEFRDLGIPFRQRGAMADEYLRIIQTAWASDMPSFQGRYYTFSGATFAPRPRQQPHPPIWVGGSPGSISSPALRRVAERCDAWHPLGLSFDDLARGIEMIREMAARAGRADAVHFAPRHLLQLATSTQGSSRVAFAGAPDEVAADIQQAQGLGCEYLTFDLPEPDVSGMLRTLERFMHEVKPGVS
jgi:probable F420-dependent oxidoreductase